MAYPNDLSRIVGGLAKLEGSNPDLDGQFDAKKAARNLIRRTIVLVKPAADAMAADTTAYTAAYQYRARCAGRLLGAYLQPQGTATAHNDNFATISAQKADGAGGAGTTMASRTTDANGGGVSLAAGVTVPMTLSATVADTRYAAGAVIGFAIAKAGSGVAVPICNILLDVEEEDVDAYGLV